MDIYKDEVEEILEDLNLLNRLYNKDYITVEEFSKIRDRMLDKMINITKKQIGNEEDISAEK
jgi:hypothetical protein